MPTIDLGFSESPGFSAREAIVRFGPTLSVEIGFDATFQPVKGMRPGIPNITFPALVDTGAQESCIDSTLAERLGLPIVGIQSVAGAHGVAEVNLHLAQIYVPVFGYTLYGRFAGVHLSSGGQPHQALLGRTFLINFTMMYDGRTDVVTLSND